MNDIPLNNRWTAVRHGTSLANEAGLIVSLPENGHDAWGLSPSGRATLETEFSRLARDPAARVVCSPFLRARETAGLLTQALGCPAPVVDPRLSERNFGPFELGSHEAYNRVWEHDRGIPSQLPATVESCESVFARVADALAELDASCRGHSIYLVSHGDPIQILLTGLEGKPLGTHRNRVPMAPGEMRSLGRRFMARPCLAGEVGSDDKPALADAQCAEALAAFSGRGWKTTSRGREVLVEAALPSGPFSASGILLARTTGVIPTDAATLFDFLMSPEGYAILDPVTPADEHHEPPLAHYQWKRGGRLELVRAKLAMPWLKADILILNATDPDRLLFVSKSVLDEALPGASRFAGGTPKGAPLRALNTFAVLVEPLGSGSCRLRCLNWLDLGGRAPAFLLNFINTRSFFPRMYRQLARRFATPSTTIAPSG